ncbi:Zinc finger and BTB domain-containing protein 38 [Aix galericulata]|nr:Zinc finger and BTB domain-containing protein 38 [Aix galericulata]
MANLPAGPGGVRPYEAVSALRAAPGSVSTFFKIPMTVMSHSKDLKDDFHSDTVLSILNEQRIRGILCDVTIIVEDTKFKAHSHVLELDDLKAEVFTEILNYIYSSTVVVKRQETVTDLAAAGKKLGISFLEDLTDVNFSSSPCPYAYCINEKGTVKEEKHEKRHEESAVTNGPRITNAFSIFETENSLFSPLDLRANFKKVSETIQTPNVSLDRSDACKDAEPASTLAEHSYAVSSGGDTFQGTPCFEQDSSPSFKTVEDHYENHHATPLVQPAKQACSTPKAAFKSQGTGLAVAKAPASTVTNTETPRTSTDSNVAPLCQITVKIGNEAIVKRHILGSKLFCKRGRKSKHESKQDNLIEESEMEIKERSPSRLYSSECLELAEMCDDVSDQDSSDKPWRPYYNYKPKKKSKQLRKMKKTKWRKKHGNRNTGMESHSMCSREYALRNAPEEKAASQEENTEMPSLHCELCEREKSSNAEIQDHVHWHRTSREGSEQNSL